MKKILLILLVLSFVLSAAACAGKNGGEESTSGSDGKNPGGASELWELAGPDGSDFKIICSEGATEKVKSLSLRLSEHIQEVTGKKIVRGYDKRSADSKEILIGLSKREATQTVFGRMTQSGYRIEWYDGDLVVVASNDYLLEAAVEDLISNRFTVQGNSIRLASDLAVEESAAGSQLFFSEGKETGFSVIIPAQSEKQWRPVAAELVKNINSLLGCSPVIRTDAQVAASPESFEILLGDTDRAEGKAFATEIGGLSAGVGVVNRKIVLAAGNEVTREAAVSLFLSELTDVKNGTYDGKYYLRSDLLAERAVIPYSEGIVEMDGKQNSGLFDNTDNIYVFTYDDVTPGDYEAYLQKLTQNGYSTTETYALGENRYALMSGETVTSYISYIAKQSMVRVYVEAKGTAQYPAKTDTATGTYEPKLWQIQNTEWTTTGAGMCYILQAKDGSFIIFDGGRSTEKEIDAIYQHLVAHTPEGEIPVISAWFFTHLHGDHVNAFFGFTDKYLNQVQIKGFYYNFPGQYFETASGSLLTASSVEGKMKKWKDATLYNKLHSGMHFEIAGIEFDVMFTLEDLYQLSQTALDANDTSMVIRVTAGGKRIMILGDMQTAASEALLAMHDKAEMKADIVQYAHHGYEGATKAVYDAIEAPTVLWPMGIFGIKDGQYTNFYATWRSKTAGGLVKEIPNPYIVGKAAYVKTIIVAGEGTTEIVLSTYTPRGFREPDYEAIYQQQKAEYEEQLAQQQAA